MRLAELEQSWHGTVWYDMIELDLPGKDQDQGTCMWVAQLSYWFCFIVYLVYYLPA